MADHDFTPNNIEFEDLPSNGLGGFVDITGQRFGIWTVLGYMGKSKWAVQCDCGVINTNIDSRSLKHGRAKGCGCDKAKGIKNPSYDTNNYPTDKVRPPIDNIFDRRGYVIGQLMIIGFSHKVTNGSPCWWCECKCGNFKIIGWGSISAGHTSSCGCLRRETARRSAKEKIRHGAARNGEITPEYSSWHSMKGRCTREGHHAWHNYGGRGVKVCQRWKKDFQSFFDDMGRRPIGHTLDRIDDDESTKHYSCGKCEECLENGWVFHCRWATYTEQANNTRRSFVIYDIHGIGHRSDEISSQYNMSRELLYYRHSKGWSYEKIIKTPVRRSKFIEFNGITLKLPDWANKVGVSPATLSWRINNWGLEKALTTPRKR